MANVRVEIEGWEELEAKLKALGEKINAQEVMEEALMAGGVIVQEAITFFAPVDTGQLGGSIEISKKGREKHSIRIGPTGAGFYGRFQEYGTSKMAAQPFMRPAFDATAAAAQLAINEAIWQAVQDAL